MKKYLVVFMALMGVAFAADTNLTTTIFSYSAIAAGIGFGIAACGGAIGMGSAAAATISGMARNPGLSGKLTSTMFIALAMIEAQVIYMLVIALVLLYANPLPGAAGLLG